MAKHTVAELGGALLDVAVGMCEGDFDPHRPKAERQMIVNAFGRVLAGPQGPATKQYEWSPSTRWEHGGRIIERERIGVDWEDDRWFAQLLHAARPDGVQLSAASGSTPLIAAMRAYCSSVFGDEVELP